MLVAQRVTKSYASRVLDEVSLEIAPGEVHALLGANGAGKSTLAKILAGVVSADSVEILFRGERIDIRNRQHARELGIEILLQELSLFETLDIAENLFVDRLPTRRWGRVDRSALDAAAVRALEKIGLELSPQTSVSSLGVGERQLVEIAGALSRDCQLLILDEPTATLSADAVGMLFERIRSLRDRGVSVLLITHRLEEVGADCRSGHRTCRRSRDGGRACAPRWPQGTGVGTWNRAGQADRRAKSRCPDVWRREEIICSRSGTDVLGPAGP